MSLFGEIAREFKAADGLTWGQIDSLWSGLLGGYQSKAGPAVGWLSSLRVNTMLACTRRIAEAVATVPHKLYQLAPGGRRTEAVSHSLYDLLDTGPNEWQDSLQFFETKAAHAALAGNAYSFINRVQGKIAELIIIEPGRCIPKQNPDYSISYRVSAPDGTVETFDQSLIWHVRGLSWDGYRGLDIVQLARESIGLALASEQTHAMVHAHGARPSGVVSVDKNLDEKELIRLAAWVRKHYGGLDNVSRVMVLDNDAKFTPFDMKGVDMQHIELRKFEIEEICRAMGVLPMVIGHPADMAARAAVDSIMGLHLVNTVRPWHRRFEKSMNRQLLTPKERESGLYCKFVDNEFLRAAAKDRAEYNKIALGGGANPGWATINDVRGWDDMDAIDGGDNIYAPVNLGPIDKDGIPKVAKPAAAAPAKPDPTAAGA